VFGCLSKEAASSSSASSSYLPQQSSSTPSSTPAQLQQQLQCTLICSSPCTFAFLPTADLSKFDEKCCKHLAAALHQQQELVSALAEKSTETKYK
jgi:hypothetical protein